jgi:metallo-beta-lactamase family protein
MSLQVEFQGATGEVTGSLYVIRSGSYTVLLECGLIQGTQENEARNRQDLPVDIDDVDAVVLSHAHIDHSGRIPLLYKNGYSGPVYTHTATRALCEIMLPDSGYLNEKDAEYENRDRRRSGESFITPLYTREDAEQCITLFRTMEYGEKTEVVPGLFVTLHDAGHILGSAIVQLDHGKGGEHRTLVFSGDLGYRDSPVLNDAARPGFADAVILESTYGDRLHRDFDATLLELGEVFANARASLGNILIPAFTVGRTQDLLYLMAENRVAWGLDNWQIFLDSPMGIDASKVYSRYRHLYGVKLFGPEMHLPRLENFHTTRTPEESMQLNEVESGAIVIAGSGMMSGGRIRHHLKHNIWRPECHLVIVGYQAYGTLGRRIVDGAETIRLWGDEYRVRAQVHTIGGLSAHGDQADLLDWYGSFDGRPPVYLVHGEPDAQKALAHKLRTEFNAPATIASRGQLVTI